MGAVVSEEVVMVGRWRAVVLCLALALGGGARRLCAQQPPAAAQTETGTLSGTVIDKSTGDPIIEAGVEVVDGGKKATTDLDGHFKLELPPGTYQLRVFAPLFQPVRLQGVVVKAKQVTTQKVSLSAAQANVETVEVIA